MGAAATWQFDSAVISRFSRYVLFASSYAPLTLAFAVLYLKDAPIVAACLVGLFVLSVAALVWLLHAVNELNGDVIIVERSARKDTETLSYLATYLVPFALAPPKDAYTGAALAIFVTVLGYLYVNSNMIYINPPRVKLRRYQ